MDRGPVHVVEDDTLVRSSLQRLLTAAGYYVTTHDSAGHFLSVAAGLTRGCVLVDIRMPLVDGLELQTRLNASGFRRPIILMTGAGDFALAVQAIRAGAMNFLAKPLDEQTLFDALDEALQADLRPDLAAEVGDADRRMAMLSPRERQVLDHLVTGKTNKAIAYELGLSERTVEVHRARMMERLGVRTFAEAVRLAVLRSRRPGSGYDA